MGFGVLKFSCVHTDTTGSIIIAVYISIVKTVSVVGVVTVSIEIRIVIANDIATNIAIGVDGETCLHLWLQGTYQLLQCPDLSTESIIC